MALLEEDFKIYEKLFEFLRSPDHFTHGDDPIYLQRRVSEQRQLLEELATCVRKSEEARKMSESHQKHLLAENELLQTKYSKERDKSLQLRVKCKAMQQNQEKFSRMKEEYQAMRRALSEETPHDVTAVDECTSCSNLITAEEKSIQTVEEENQNEMQTDAPKEKGHTVQLTRSELNRLEDDMVALKTVLQQREATWSKMAARERFQRVQLNRLNHELNSLRALASSRQSELDVKTKTLNDLNTRILEKNEETVELRKQISKMERREKEFSGICDRKMEMYMAKLQGQQRERHFTGQKNKPSRKRTQSSYC